MMQKRPDENLPPYRFCVTKRQSMLRRLKSQLHFYQLLRMNVPISLRQDHMQLALESKARHNSLDLEECLALCKTHSTAIIRFLLISLDY